MWCFCFKPSKTTDIYEDEIARYRILDDELLAKGIQESLNQQDSSPPHQVQQEKEEDTREVEYPLQYDEDAHVAEAVKQSLKEEGERKQREEDEKIAKDLQNMVESPPRIEKGKRIYHSVPLDVVDEQIAKAVKESLKEEDKRKQLEEQAKKDEHIAKDLQNNFHKMEIEERRRLLDESMLDDEDEQVAKTVEKSLEEKGKQKQFEEQTKKDEQIAQDLQNRFRKMAYEESSGLHDESVLVKEDEWPAKTVETRLKEKGKRKQFEYERAKKDEQIAKDLQNHFSKMTYEESIRQHDESVLDDEDEQLAKAVEKSLMEKGKGKQTKDEVEEDEKLPEVMNPPPSICGGCKFEIERERSVDISGVLWHPECLWCDACQKPIAIHEVENHVSNSRGKFHKPCYERYCYICKEKKMRRYNEHHFWKERYCRTHECDGTPKCCSCERFEPRGTNYVMLDDRRWLCLECMESAVMDSHECQHLHFEIREYFEGLNMKIEKEFPFLLVEKQALNKAKKEEKDYQYEAVTRGICLSEEQTVMSVSKATRTGASIDTDKEPQRVVRKCEVTAILILYGFPRLLTGYILAHEMMHAYLRLNGHRKLNEVHEEGICQVLGHMWLESQRYAAIDDIAAAATSSSSQTPVPVASSKKGDQSEFEKRLVEFCINQIETDESPVYGDGFRRINKMVMNSNLKDTLKEILRLG